MWLSTWVFQIAIVAKVVIPLTKDDKISSSILCGNSLDSSIALVDCFYSFLTRFEHLFLTRSPNPQNLTAFHSYCAVIQIWPMRLLGEFSSTALWWVWLKELAYSISRQSYFFMMYNDSFSYIFWPFPHFYLALRDC